MPDVKKPVQKISKKVSLEDLPDILKFSLLFEEAEVPFLSLYPLGLGRGDLRLLPHRREDPRHSSLDLHTIFNIDNLVEGYSKVVWYKAQSVLDDSKTGIFMIMFDKLWIGSDQLAEFREHIENRVETSDKLNDTLWANFHVRA